MLRFVLVPMLFSDEYLFTFCMCACVCRYRCFDKYWLISAFCMYYKCFGIISYLLKIFTNMTILHVSPYTLLIQIKQVDIWHRYFTYYLLRTMQIFVQKTVTTMLIQSPEATTEVTTKKAHTNTEHTKICSHLHI